MPGEFFFMALGGLGVSLAGFVGIITALDRSHDARSIISMWRLRNIVWAGFTLTIVGFGIVAVYAVTGDELDTAVRIAALFAILANGIRSLIEFRPGPAWPSRKGWAVAILLEGIVLAGLVATALTTQVGLLQLMLIFQLGFPLSIFFFTIRDAAGGGSDETP